MERTTPMSTTPMNIEPMQPEPPEAQPTAELPGSQPPPNPPTPTPPTPNPPQGRRRIPGSLIAALVVAVLVISCAVALNITTGALGKLNPFHNGVVQERTIDRSSPVVLKAITDLGQFHAASGYYELVVDVERDVKPVPSFLAGERVLFIAAGTVDVGVDLRGLSGTAIQVDQTRTSATLTLPKPTLGPPVLDLEHSYIYSRQRGLVNRIKDAVGSDTTGQQQLYTLAEARLAQAAQRTDELTTRGEANTRAMLQGLLRSLGFTAVTVNFSG